MRQIGTSEKYGAVYDSPGGTGGGYMVHVDWLGWIKNPNYGATPATRVPVTVNEKAVAALYEGWKIRISPEK